MSTPWTAAQKQAIATTGRSVLVSAGAGSGKTAVLAERCVHLVLDAQPPSRVDRLLVVTFTEAAAAQMRDRIARALRARQSADPANTRIRQQLALLDGASISTIHAFCKRVLDRYFAQAGVDPASPIMDAHDAALLRRDLVDAVFRDFAAREDDAGERFHHLIQNHGAGREFALIDLILGLDAFLDSIADPDRWLTDAGDRLRTDNPDELPAFWQDLLAKEIAVELADQMEHVNRAIQTASDAGDIGALFTPCLNDYADAIETWRHALGHAPTAKTVDAVCTAGIGQFKFPSIPDARSKAVKSLPPDARAVFDRCQRACREIRDALFAARLSEPYGRFTSTQWAQGLARTSGHVQIIVELVREVRQRYAAEKAELGVLDFSDLECRTLLVLRDDESGVAGGLRDRFDHVLVDEFQDVNPIQAEILRRVSREDDPQRNHNLFAVGDVKQSIYRFRLAEPRLFLDRLARFQTPGDTAQTPNNRTGVAIDLVENFRSDEHIIDAVNAVFARLITPDLGGVIYDDRSRLVHGLPRSTGPRAVPGIELHLLEDTARAAEDDAAAAPAKRAAVEDAGDWERIEREAYVIARRIEMLRDAGTPWSDMVILLRSLANRAPLMIRALSRMGVPVHAEVAGGFFDALEVNDCLALLALLDNSRQDLPLAAVLRSPIVGEPFTDSELVALRTHVPDRRAFFHTAVFAYARDGADAGLRNRLAAFLERLQEWRQVARHKPLADVVWRLLHETNYLAFVEGLPQGAQRRANLIALHDHARKFATFGRQGLHRFLRFIDQMRDAEMDLEPAAVTNASADVVRVMSIHRSKGLEFPVVFLAELGKRFNMAEASGSILFDRELGLGLKAVDVDKRITYPTLAHNLVTRRIRMESLSEEMRVLYVALTRAKKRLILVGTGDLQKLDAPDQTPADGPLPAIQRRSARSALDWVLPAVCAAPPAAHRIDKATPGTISAPLALPTGRPAPLFHTIGYAVADMSKWTMDPPRVVHAEERLAKLSRMSPLPADLQPAGPPPDLAVLRRRLTDPYRAAPLAAIPAVAAASELKRRWEHGPHIDGEASARVNAAALTAGTGPSGARNFRFSPPDFVGIDDADASTRRGTSTHAFLQHVDLHRACDRPDLESQLKAMIERGLITPDEAEQINLDDAAWFFDAPLGRRMRSPAAAVRREWPFVLSASPTRFDPGVAPLDGGDRLLVRGIIDCLLNDDGRWDVIDYKTDRVAGAALDERAGLYRGQLSIYAEAVDKLWPGAVGRKWLVFLNARKCVEV